MGGQAVKSSYLVLAAFALASVLAPNASRAEVSTIRLAKQYGLAYLPLTIMQEEKILEKEVAKSGQIVKTEWLQFSAGSGMNEALLSGNLDVASGGVGPMLTIWSRTLKNYKIRGISAMASLPLYLVTVNPNVKSIADFGSADKIAMPTVKTSIQAITLQMAAEKQFGKGQATKLDPLTVSLSHPDAQIAMLGGKAGITSHFGSSPFQEMELKDPRAHRVIDSYEVLDGPHTFSVAWATDKFVTGNPKIVAAFYAALKESINLINSDPKKAASLWIKGDHLKLSEEDAEAIIQNPENKWTTEPQKLLVFLNGMHAAGLINDTTSNWKDLFFNYVHDTKGS
ncbi:ABC transporter substrate-binding protein [Bradyrhizobium liaoningense]|nr:ABC transporter substrate-binding protein [Bradyrhizobium liaoningense]